MSSEDNLPNCAGQPCDPSPKKECKLTRTPSSSSGEEEWTLLNTQGAEIENFACQTDGAARAMSISQTSSIVDATGQNEENTLTEESLSFPLKSTASNVPRKESLTTSVTSSTGSEFVRLSHGSSVSSLPSLVASGQVTANASRRTSQNVEDDTPYDTEDDLSVVEDVTESIFEENLDSTPRFDEIDLANLRSTPRRGSHEVAPLPQNLNISQDCTALNHSNGSFSDELPVNFVHMCSNRIKNYVHASNSRLNWTLTLLALLTVTAVIGLGMGHFIGSTTVWLRNRYLRRPAEVAHPHEVSKMCVQLLDGQRVAHVNELKGLETLYQKCQHDKNFVRDHCHADDRPKCGGQQQQHVHPTSADLLHELRQNLSALEERYGQLSTQLAQEKRQKHAEELKVANLVNTTTLLMQNLSNLRARELQMMEQESQLRLLIDQLEHVMTNLKSELTNQRRAAVHYQSEYHRCSKDAEMCERDDAPSSDDGDTTDSEQGFEEGWPKFQQLFEQLKNASNFTELLGAYSWLLENMSLPQHTEIAGRLRDEFSKLKEVYGFVQTTVAGKLTDFVEEIKATDWESYMTQTREHLQTFWSKAKDFSAHMATEHRKQAQAVSTRISEQLGSLGDHFGSKWASLQQQWEEAVKKYQANDAATNSIEEPSDDDLIIQPVEEAEVVNVDDSSCEGQAAKGDYAEDSLTSLLEEKRTTLQPGITIDYLSSFDPHEKEIAKKLADEEQLKRITQPTIVEQNLYSAKAEVKNFRDALKRSTFQAQLEGDASDMYLDRLKRFTKSSEISTADYMWWQCQKLWWTDSFKEPPYNAAFEDCENKLLTWQMRRTGYNSVKPGSFWSPYLLPIMDEWILLDGERFGDSTTSKEERSRTIHRDSQYSWRADRKSERGRKQRNERSKVEEEDLPTANGDWTGRLEARKRELDEHFAAQAKRERERKREQRKIRAYEEDSWFYGFD